MRAILASLPASDGVACFAQLYLDVTEGVRGRLADTTFAAPRFVDALDARFADLFFAAVDAFAHDPSSTPRAWAPLFEARTRRGIAPLQFALAGMNAHINRDLPVALDATCAQLGVDLAEGSPEHADYRRVNAVLAEVEHAVKQRYLTGCLRALDRILHRVDRLDDVVAMWDVARARDAAWTNGAALWSLRGDAPLRAGYLEVLDRAVGFAGRGLLIPAETWLGRLARAL
jgi:hypothetical protein